MSVNLNGKGFFDDFLMLNFMFACVSEMLTFFYPSVTDSVLSMHSDTKFLNSVIA